MDAAPHPDHAPFVAIDFETANNARHSACAVALVRVEGGELVRREARLIQPPSQSFTNTRVHGIRWRDVAQAPTFDAVWADLAPLLDGAACLVAHNAPFDRSVLSACCAYYDLAAPSLPFACTVQVSRKTWPLASHRLPVVCAHLGIDLKHHDAASDAAACATILVEAIRRTPDALTRELSRANAAAARKASGRGGRSRRRGRSRRW